MPRTRATNRTAAQKLSNQLKSRDKHDAAASNPSNARPPEPAETRAEGLRLTRSSHRLKASPEEETIQSESQQKKRAKSDVASSQTAKKAKPSAPLLSVRTYNLRATTARKSTAVTVTPASTAVPRQIRFDEDGPVQARVGSPPMLPRGVVNIFDDSQRLCKLPQCNCPTDIYNESSIALVHTAHYGEEERHYLKQKEDIQMTELKRYVPLNMSSSTADGVESDDDESNDGDSSSDASPPRLGVLMPRRVWRKEGDNASAAATRPLPRQPCLSPKMRATLVNWLVEVAMEYKMSSIAFHLAVTLVDLMLLRGPLDDGESFGDPEHWLFNVDDDPDPPCFLIQRSEFQALGWYVSCWIDGLYS